MKLLIPALFALLVNSSNPMFVGSDDKTLQTATITNQNLVAAIPESGLYRVACHVIVTRAATTSSSLTLKLNYTDVDQNAAVTVMCGGFNSAGTATTSPSNAISVTGTQDFIKLINAKVGTAVTYTATYVSSGATTMQYALHIRCESL